MKIVLRYPDGKNLSFKLTEGLNTIGRSSACSVSVPDEALSRMHAQIEIHGDSIVVTDLDSSNGVFVDGLRIAAGKKVSYSTFQSLSIGALEAQIIIEDTFKGALGENKQAEKKLSLEQTKTITRTKTNALEQPKKSSKHVEKEKSSSINQIVMFVTILTFVLFFYKYYQDPTGATPQPSSAEAKKLEIPTVKKKTPVKIQIVEDKFLLNAIYEEGLASATCTKNQDTCTEMNLAETSKEGITVYDSDIIIYYKSNVHTKDSIANPTESEPRIEDLSGLYLLLKSSLVGNLGSREFSHLHLVIINQDNKLIRVYRIHPDTFKDSRIKLLKAFSMVKSDQKIETFFLLMDEFIPSKKF